MDSDRFSATQKLVFLHLCYAFSSSKKLTKPHTCKQTGLGHGQLSLDWSPLWTGCCFLIKLRNGSSFSTTHTNSIVNLCQFQTDQGPDNMALAAHLKYHLKLHVAFFWDVMHETVNSVDQALQKGKFDNVCCPGVTFGMEASVGSMAQSELQL